MVPVDIAPTSATEGSSDAVQAQIASAVSEVPSGAVQGQITPPTVDTEVSSNVAESETSSQDFAQELAAIFKRHEKPLPFNIDEVVNPKDLDARLNIALQQVYWKHNSIPVYDKGTSHFPSDIFLDPSESDSFFNFFWLDEDLDLIVKESNENISKKKSKKKNKKKNRLKHN